MTGGTLVTKSGGTSYRALDCGTNTRVVCNTGKDSLYTFVSKSEMTNTKQICTHYLGGAGFINIRHSSGKQVTGVIPGSSGNLCMTVDASTWTDGAIYVSVLSDGNPSNPISKAQIDTIYGKP